MNGSGESMIPFLTLKMTGFKNRLNYLMGRLRHSIIQDAEHASFIQLVEVCTVRDPSIRIEQTR